MGNPLELLTTVTQGTLNPCLRARGITTGRAKVGHAVGGFVCAQIPVQHEPSGAAGVLSVSVVPNGFADGGPQWAVLVCRIMFENGPPLDKACVYAGGERLRSDFGELLELFVNSPKTTGPPPSLRRSTVILD